MLLLKTSARKRRFPTVRYRSLLCNEGVIINSLWAGKNSPKTGLVLVQMCAHAHKLKQWLLSFVGEMPVQMWHLISFVCATLPNLIKLFTHQTVKEPSFREWQTGPICVLRAAEVNHFQRAQCDHCQPSLNSSVVSGANFLKEMSPCLYQHVKH